MATGGREGGIEWGGRKDGRVGGKVIAHSLCYICTAITFSGIQTCSFFPLPYLCYLQVV